MAKSPSPHLRGHIRAIMSSAPNRRWTKSAIIRGVQSPAYDPEATPEDISREIGWNVAQGYLGEEDDHEMETTNYTLTILGKSEQGCA